jgi:hypothetical protein
VTYSDFRLQSVPIDKNWREAGREGLSVCPSECVV